MSCFKSGGLVAGTKVFQRCVIEVNYTGVTEMVHKLMVIRLTSGPHEIQMCAMGTYTHMLWKPPMYADLCEA